MKAAAQSAQAPLHHQHPINMLENASKRLWLLLFPLLRGLLALGFDVFSWVRGAWFDILILIVLIVFAIARWRLFSYRLLPDGIYFKRGRPVYAQTLLPYSLLSSISIERPWLYRPLGVVRVRMETMAGSKRSADLRMTLSSAHALELERALASFCTPKEVTRRTYTPAKRHLILFSILSSSTLSGALFLSALISQTGAILGRKLQDELFATLTDFSRRVALGLPPIAIALSAVLLLGWLVGFSLNIFRHLRFNIARCGNYLHIQSGVVTHRLYLLDCRRVIFFNLRQTLLTKIFSIASVFIYCTGYGKAKNEMNILIPATSTDEIQSTMQHLLPSLSPVPISLHPRPYGLLAFVLSPLIAIALPPFLMHWLTTPLPEWQQLIYFIFIMAEIPALWLLLVRVAAFLTTGLGRNGDMLTLSYARGLRFHTVTLNASSIVRVDIRQTLFQRIGGSCDIVIYAQDETSHPHILRQIAKQKAVAMLDLQGLT